MSYCHVIRYAYHSHWGYDKSKFLFLFSKNVTGGIGADAKEGHLQDSLFESLKHTTMAQYFEYEKGKVASGGRVDIIFQCDKMRIPIEVKKTDESPTLESIEKYYIAQAQTYASAYDQLGIFVLLDLSDKGKKPTSNFKDWFNLHHLSPATNLPVNHPDYVVSVVIPGNKLLPSMFVYGISDKKTGGLDFHKPNGNISPVYASELSKNVPEPFKSEPNAGIGTRMHHKFVIIDFNTPDARVYLGSYNFSSTADRKNGENLLLIKDRKIAIAYMIEALRIFDHYHFRVSQKESTKTGKILSLTRPPRNLEDKAWWEEYYTDAVKIKDRELFA